MQVDTLRAIFADHYTGEGLDGPELHIVTSSRPGTQLQYLAPAPIDRRASFTGSGLPYASTRQAFSGSPNQGVAKAASDGKVELRLASPGCFYECCGTEFRTPFVILRYPDGECEARPLNAAGCRRHRDLTYPEARTSPLFYDRPLEVQDQWVRLLATAI